MNLKIKKLISDAMIPSYAHAGDAGLDLYSCEEVLLKPMERRMIKTGISMAIPHGYVGLIWDKSGMAAKYGLKTMAGVVDAGYRGEIIVVLHNLSANDFLIEKNSKIAQMLIQPVHSADVVEVDSLDETSRGNGAWGSTGLK
jgi:dUTP pyrophosphatase